MEKKKSNKNKIILVSTIVGIIVLLVAFLLLSSCSKKEYKVTFIDNIDKSEINTVKIKENEKVKRPSDPKKDGYIFDDWYYNNVIYDFNTKVTKDMKIVAKFKKADDIVLKNSSFVLEVGETKNIEIKALPKGLSLSDLIWLSSDETILSVDKNGKIKALKEGEVTVTVKSRDGSYETSCKIKITKNKIAVEKVEITGASEVNVGSTIKLTAKISPNEATDKEVSWKSSNTNIAVIDKDGNVKGIKAGEVTITVTTNDGNKTATHKVTVKAKTSNPSQNTPSGDQKPNNPSNPSTPEPPKTYPVESVSISGPTSVNVGNTILLTANITPSNATDKTVIWRSGNDGIATVDQNGNVTGVNDGEVTITVETSNGKTATYKVTVKSDYVITFTEIKQDVTGSVMQYSFSVTKNGVNLDNLKAISFNAIKSGTSRTVLKGNLIAAEDILYDGSRLVTATIILTDNSKVTSNITLVYK